MIDETQIHQIKRELSRVFALPITRSTLREIQNSLVAICPTDSNAVFQSLVNGTAEDLKKIAKNEKKLSELIEEFSIPVKVAKDVYERGEFITLVSSDIISQQNRVAFLNRIRRVDGEEMHFFTDTRGTVNLLNHLIDRLQELQKNEIGKETIKNSKEELSSLKKKLDQLTK